MSPGPTVGIVIPTYNRAGMVMDAVESALAQTGPGPVVVVDDGSTDDTLERLRRFGDRITVVAKENEERGAARNAGAEVAGDVDLLCFLDADDVLRPDHTATLRRLARRHPDASLVSTGALLVDEGLQPLTRVGGGGGPVDLEGFLMAEETLPQGATAYRRDAFEAVGGFDERRALAGSEDWLLTARVLALGAGIRHDEVTVLIRKHEANTMQDAASMERSMLLAREIFFDEIWHEVRTEPEARELPDAIRKRSEARLRTNAATQYYAVGEMSRARSLLREAAARDPAVMLEPKWSWTWLRSLLGRRLSRWLRGLKHRIRARAGDRGPGPPGS